MAEALAPSLRELARVAGAIASSTAQLRAFASQLEEFASRLTAHARGLAEDLELGRIELGENPGTDARIAAAIREMATLLLPLVGPLEVMARAGKQLPVDQLIDTVAELERELPA